MIMHLAARTVLILSGLVGSVTQSAPLECTNWQSTHPDWVWCDDFESDAALTTSYFDVNRANGFGVTTSTALGGQGALKATYIPGKDEAGNIKLGIGHSPVASKLQTSKNFDDLYWRFYVKMGATWVGNPNKLTRATIFTSANWAQAAIFHIWEDATDRQGLALEPVSSVAGSQVMATKYNDFSNFRWLGHTNGVTQIYAPEYRDRWICVEAHMKLNTPGAADGIGEYWVDSKSEVRRADLNWRGSYTGHGINAVMIENFQNAGPMQTQSRYFDNFVVSTKRIGCLASVLPKSPTDMVAQ